MIIHAIVHSYGLAMTPGPIGLCQQVMTPVQEAVKKKQCSYHTIVSKETCYLQTLINTKLITKLGLLPCLIKNMCGTILSGEKTETKLKAI